MKPIKDYEGLYSVTEDGQVWSHRNEKFLKPNIRNDGYLHITLCKHSNMKYFLIHRLVLKHFVLNPNNKQFCNHKNGVKSDNRINNLEWVTRSENMKHAFRTGLRVAPKGEKHPYSKLTEESVGEIRKLLEKGKLLQKEIGEKFGVTNHTINKINTDRNWKHIN